MGMEFEEDTSASKRQPYCFLSWLPFKQRKSHPVSVSLAGGLPLFIKPGQIQLVGGPPPNLLTCSALSTSAGPANMSFLQRLMISAGDAQWDSFHLGSPDPPSWPDLIFLHEIGWQLPRPRRLRNKRWWTQRVTGRPLAYRGAHKGRRPGD